MVEMKIVITDTFVTVTKNELDDVRNWGQRTIREEKCELVVQALLPQVQKLMAMSREQLLALRRTPSDYSGDLFDQLRDAAFMAGGLLERGGDRSDLDEVDQKITLARERFREIRLWHWRIHKGDVVPDDPSFHMRAVQALNDLFPLGDTAERDDGRKT